MTGLGRAMIGVASVAVLAVGAGGCQGSTRAGRPVTDRLSGVDWAAQVRDCSREHGGSGLGTVITSVGAGDLTGDGLPDTWVVDQCEAATSSWPQVVEVFDGASDPARPVRLATLLDGDPDYQRGVAVSVQPGGRVVVTGRASSPDAPRCCPDLVLRKVFAYSGGRFVLAESTAGPLPPPS